MSTQYEVVRYVPLPPSKALAVADVLEMFSNPHDAASYAEEYRGKHGLAKEDVQVEEVWPEREEGV